MGQEFFVKSDGLEQKVRELLPSQGGLGAGFDLSATTQIVPIIDLTESAEGSNVRQDLQTALSLNSVEVFDLSNTSSDIITNTGYYRVFGNSSMTTDTNNNFTLSDGVTTKRIWAHKAIGSVNFELIVFIPAGQKLIAQSQAATGFLIGSTRQIATIDGVLTDPI